MKYLGRSISVSISVLVVIIIVSSVNAFEDSNTTMENDTSLFLSSMTITGPEPSSTISEPNELSGETLLVKSASLGAQTTSPPVNISGIEWQKVIGGSWGESFFDINQTHDKGYVAIGATGSKDGDVASGWLNQAEAWVVKMDATGTIQWQKLYGGYGYDQGMSIEPTSDGGYVFAGFSNSTDGDFAGHNHGGQDAWVVKLDSTGNKSWQGLFGGSGDDLATTITTTSDGGYVVTGYTDSPVFNDSMSTLTSHGGTDMFVLKLDKNGKKEWSSLLGGSGYDRGSAVARTSDNGCIVIGFTNSSDSGDIGTNHGYYDIFVAKMDSAGGIEWKKMLGGSNSEATAYDNGIQQTADGGYIFVGQTASSNDGDVSTGHGASDVWVVKLEGNGVIQWEKTLGGTGYDRGNAIRQTPDGDYILIGDITSGSSGNVADANHGNWDTWVVKLDPDGKLLWQSVLGGNSYEQGNNILPTWDGGFITAGLTWSDNTGTVAGTYHRCEDAWVVKLKPRLVVDVLDSDTKYWVPNITVTLHDNKYNEDQNLSAIINGRVVFTESGSSNQYRLEKGVQYTVKASADKYRDSNLGSIVFSHDGQKVILNQTPLIAQYDNSFSITCIENYDNIGSIPGSFDECNNVSSKLISAGYKMNFYHKDDEVTIKDFASDPSYTGHKLTESAFHYHTGHGSSISDGEGGTVSLILLKAFGILDYITGKNQITTSDVEKKWGGKTKWVAIQSCKILQDDEWGNALTTSHGILGYSSSTGVNSSFPIVFFNYVLDKEKKMTIVSAYKRATLDSWHDENIKAKVITKTLDQLYLDRFPTEGYMAPDGDPDSTEIQRLDWDCKRGDEW